jgi:hypothetical protein
VTVPILICYQNHTNIVNVIFSTYCDNFVTIMH